MILAAMLFALAQPEVTLGAMGRLTPDEAAALALAGKHPGPMQSVIRLPPHGMDPPGFFPVEMIEKPVTVAGGCRRLRWKLSFQQRAGAAVDEAVLWDAHSVVELALASTGGCPTDDYVHLNPEVEAAEGLAALQRLKAIASGRHRPAITCKDETGSTLCMNDETTRRALARLKPWAVTRQGDALAIWLGVPGEVVTEVKFTRSDVAVERRIPAPF